MEIADEQPRSLAWARSLLVSFGLLGACFTLARITSAYIATRFPDRVAPPDLLFQTLPYMPWTQYVTDIALFTEAGLLFWYLSRGRWRRFSGMAAMFSIFHVLRAVITTLTPLAGPLGNGAFYGLIHVTQNGEFPSGHVGGALMLYLFIDGQGQNRRDAPETWTLEVIPDPGIGGQCLAELDGNRNCGRHRIGLPHRYS